MEGSHDGRGHALRRWPGRGLFWSPNGGAAPPPAAVLAQRAASGSISDYVCFVERGVRTERDDLCGHRDVVVAAIQSVASAEVAARGGRGGVGDRYGVAVVGVVVDGRRSFGVV